MWWRFWFTAWVFLTGVAAAQTGTLAADGRLWTEGGGAALALCTAFGVLAVLCAPGAGRPGSAAERPLYYNVVYTLSGRPDNIKLLVCRTAADALRFVYRIGAERCRVYYDNRTEVSVPALITLARDEGTTELQMRRWADDGATARATARPTART
jgi:hypothetical protein